MQNVPQQTKKYVLVSNSTLTGCVMGSIRFSLGPCFMHQHMEQEAKKLDALAVYKISYLFKIEVLPL